MFGCPHIREFRLRGPEGTLDLIQRVTSNDASKPPGKAQYSCLPNQDGGGIVDDLLVYMLVEEDYLVVTLSNIEKD
jgi:aminomethyltransferase